MSIPGLDVRGKRRKQVKGNSKVFLLICWKMELPLTVIVNLAGRVGLWRV